MSPLERLQVFVAGKLESEAYFADIGVYVLRPRRKRDGSLETVPAITQKIEGALNGLVKKGGKSGAAVTVLMPVASSPSADMQTLLDVTTIVRVQEASLLNMGATGTRKSAEEISLEVIRALNGWVPSGVAQQLYCARETMTFNESFVGEGKWTYDIAIASHLEIAEPERVARPRLSLSGGEVTITCSTDGAAIYFTTDGSFPGPENQQATMYLTAFVPPEGATDVFAAAYLSGMHGSDAAWLELEVEVGETPANAALREDGGTALREDGGVALREQENAVARPSNAALREDDETALREAGETALREQDDAAEDFTALREDGGAALREDGGAAEREN